MVKPIDFKDVCRIRSKNFTDRDISAEKCGGGGKYKPN